MASRCSRERCRFQLSPHFSAAAPVEQSGGRREAAPLRPPRVRLHRAGRRCRRLHRPRSYYNKTEDGEEDPDTKGKSDIIIAKQQRPTGTVYLACLSDYTRFENSRPGLVGGTRMSSVQGGEQCRPCKEKRRCSWVQSLMVTFHEDFSSGRGRLHDWANRLNR